MPQIYSRYPPESVHQAVGEQFPLLIAVAGGRSITMYCVQAYVGKGGELPEVPAQ